MTRTLIVRLFSMAVVLAAFSPSSVRGENQVSTAVTCADSLSSGDYLRQVPGWPDRDYLLHVPANYDCRIPTPVVLALHGGGSNKEDMRALTCPDGDLDNPRCLDHLADREGFIVVYPDGVKHLLWRTFNATDRESGAAAVAPGYACVSGYACETDTDALGYFNALLDTVESEVNVDEHRVFATGISNGAAMAHRLACEMSDRIAAIASVAGGNQYSVFHACKPGRAVPVIEFHGTADPAWGYGTMSSDLNLNGQGAVISVPRTVSGWAERNGCYMTPVPELIPNRDLTDKSTVTHFRYRGCEAGGDVELYRINGGGHMWPDGYQWDVLMGRYGPTNRDINGNEVMWDFFRLHPRP